MKLLEKWKNKKKQEKIIIGIVIGMTILNLIIVIGMLIYIFNWLKTK